MSRLEDDELPSLVGATVRSEQRPEVAYTPQRKLGTGAFAVAFLARRSSPEGESDVVLKVMRAGVLRDSADVAGLLYTKEAVALGRLNERVPPTPFVVRMIETGKLRVPGAGDLPLPWIAMEHVHGGPAGTTLEARVASSIEQSGFAFDRERIERVIDCLGAGLAAVHEVGVIHRDLTPGNVLCSGWGDQETFKIADFGLARPSGEDATFGAIPIGTPGYAAPEQSGAEAGEAGPQTDVFALAAVLFFAITGQDLFDEATPVLTLTAPLKPTRKSIAASPHLAPDLRDAETVRELDAVFAAATARHAARRPPSALALTSLVTGALLAASGPVASTRFLPRKDAAPRPRAGTWTFRTVQTPRRDAVVFASAWDGPGRCLAITATGMQFWDGIAWRIPTIASLGRLTPRCAHTVAPGQFLIGGARGALALLARGQDTRTLIHASNATVMRANGDPRDLAAVALEHASGAPEVCAVASERWVRGVALPPGTVITALERIDASRWVVAGRAAGAAAAWSYEPLQFELRPLAVGDGRALLCAASRPDRGEVVLAGTDGNVLALDAAGALTPRRIAERPNLSAVAIDPTGRWWGAAAGELWTGSADGAWTRAWAAGERGSPIVSVFADTSLVRALTVDGGVVEGVCAT